MDYFQMGLFMTAAFVFLCFMAFKMYFLIVFFYIFSFYNVSCPELPIASALVI